jgi:hypothetical protein
VITKAKPTVEEFFNNLALNDADAYSIAVALRKLIKKLAKNAEERVMYGGILYYLDDSFCGIFAYKSHVSLEFGRGNLFEDKDNLLEGTGKFRRHIKFTNLKQIKEKQAGFYIQQAIDHINI